MVVFPVLNYHLRTSASYTSWHMNIVNVTVWPYGVPQYQHPVFYGVRVPLTFVTVKCYMGRLFIFFLLTIVLPVLQFTDSHYTFDSFIFFLYTKWEIGDTSNYHFDIPNRKRCWRRDDPDVNTTTIQLQRQNNKYF